MQIKIGFSSESEIILPIHYNHILQAFIYNNIDKNLACFMHDEGYMSSGRKFKLFTFSNILKRGILKDKKFNFKKEIDIIIASPIEGFCKSIVNSMFLNNNLILGKNSIKASKIEILDKRIDSEQIEIETISPITVYSTILKENGNKFTHYYRASEGEFEKLIGENLIKKYKAFYGENLSIENDIQIIAKGNIKQSIIYYKNFIVKGETGIFTVKGNKNLLQIGLDAGFGSKNSQGFGCGSLLAY